MNTTTSLAELTIRLIDESRGDDMRPGQFKMMVLIGAALLIAGCASAPKDKFIELMWPEPPLTPRIKFVRNFATEKDLERKAGFGESFLKFLTGRMPPNSQLYQPVDVAVSPDGNRFYVSDYARGLVFRFNIEEKKVKLFGKFSRPFGIALDKKDRLYVAEQGTKYIRVIDQEGNKLKSITHESLERPADLALDEKRGLIYVVDGSFRNSKDHLVKVFDLEGKFLRDIGRGKGHGPGQLYFPTYVAVDKEGRVYVTETMNARVSVFNPEGKFLRHVGERGDAFGMFDKPKGIALDSFDNLYVVDSAWSNVQIFNQKGRVLLFFGGRGDYPGLLKNPTGIAIDGQNRIYVADYLHNQVAIYQLVNTKAEDSYIELPQAKGDGASQSPAVTNAKEKRR
jgi:DNA-binding beta-propeller fold protein YncE